MFGTAPPAAPPRAAAAAEAEAPRRVVVDAKRADDRAPIAQDERLPRQQRLALPPRRKAREQPVPGAALVLEDVAVLR